MSDLPVQNTDSPPPRRRASTRDREASAAILSAAMAEGMLNPVEFDDRSASVYAATYRDELVVLTADVDHAELRTPAGRRSGAHAIRRGGAALNAMLTSSLATAMHHRRAAVAIGLVLVLMVIGLTAVSVGIIAETGTEITPFDHEQFSE
ncbi:DUF1707 SHOCT-like domain-containing protein [Gordonia insulae]|uniref:DUF1707 domain-containing protein n=1 Tax=Gordonia insulae TaxID=2420509 RepID=A0A3G8JMF3_9ACTN|nr:DUF1707 domain-containing protein [Gordonia insulae]AZG46261.1 hypothetical protein D7316_02862 [Gordonia insulae]